jgi:CRP-like cAMP-binding protein
MDNQLLASLRAPHTLQSMQKFRRVRLPLGRILFQPDEPLESVYFPSTAVISLLNVMDDGRVVEIATVGKEGVIGARSLFAPKTALTRAVVQIEGEALVISDSAFRQEAGVNSELQELMLRYNEAFLAQLIQTAGCNSLHTAPQRCARWLLMVHDRADLKDFRITHQFLADMLAVRRQTVQAVANQLQEKGLIRYSRGRVSILNRAGLERAACECYEKVRNEYLSIMKPVRR